MVLNRCADTFDISDQVHGWGGRRASAARHGCRSSFPGCDGSFVRVWGLGNCSEVIDGWRLSVSLQTLMPLEPVGLSDFLVIYCSKIRIVTLSLVLSFTGLVNMELPTNISKWHRVLTVKYSLWNLLVLLSAFSTDSYMSPVDSEDDMLI